MPGNYPSSQPGVSQLACGRNYVESGPIAWEMAAKTTRSMPGGVGFVGSPPTNARGALDKTWRDPSTKPLFRDAPAVKAPKCRPSPTCGVIRGLSLVTEQSTDDVANDLVRIPE